MLFMVSILMAAYAIPLYPEEPAGRQKAPGGSRTAVVPAGAPFYTPDTKLGFGLYVITCIEQEDSSRKAGEISLFCTATQEMQASVGVMPEVYFGDGGFKFSGYLEANRYPGSFWGIGPGTEDEEMESYEPIGLKMEASFLKRIADGFFAGPRIAYSWSDITPEGPRLSSVPGGRGSIDVGVGFALNFDTRDSPFYPREGFLIDLAAESYRKDLGSGSDFYLIEADLRHYAAVFGEAVLALQGRLQISGGKVPFQALPSLGGNGIMRGYQAGRYVDKTSLAAQAELRFPLVARLGGAVFFGAGDVRPSLAGYAFEELKASAGAGLRFILDRERQITARIDVGITAEGSPGVYVLVKEAF
jgi:hypothetical protein